MFRKLGKSLLFFLLSFGIGIPSLFCMDHDSSSQFDLNSDYLDEPEYHDGLCEEVMELILGFLSNVTDLQNLGAVNSEFKSFIDNYLQKRQNRPARLNIVLREDILMCKLADFKVDREGNDYVYNKLRLRREKFYLFETPIKQRRDALRARRNLLEKFHAISGEKHLKVVDRRGYTTSARFKHGYIVMDLIVTEGNKDFFPPDIVGQKRAANIEELVREGDWRDVSLGLMFCLPLAAIVGFLVKRDLFFVAIPVFLCVTTGCYYRADKLEFGAPRLHRLCRTIDERVTQRIVQPVKRCIGRLGKRLLEWLADKVLPAPDPTGEIDGYELIGSEEQDV